MTDKAGRVVEYVAHIRCVATGEVRAYRDVWSLSPDDEWGSTWVDGFESHWLEGNNSCDCNRRMMFAEAGGEEAEHGECGDSAYEVDAFDIDGKRYVIRGVELVEVAQ